MTNVEKITKRQAVELFENVKRIYIPNISEHCSILCEIHWRELMNKCRCTAKEN